MEGFKVISKIGEGSYSTVLKVQRKADGNIYALKESNFINYQKKKKRIL